MPIQQIKHRPLTLTPPSPNTLTRREFVLDGLKERRKTGRYFRDGYYGSRSYRDKLKLMGLVSKSWKTGPKKDG